MWLQQITTHNSYLLTGDVVLSCEVVVKSPRVVAAINITLSHVNIVSTSFLALDQINNTFRVETRKFLGPSPWRNYIDTRWRFIESKHVLASEVPRQRLARIRYVSPWRAKSERMLASQCVLPLCSKIASRQHRADILSRNLHKRMQPRFCYIRVCAGKTRIFRRHHFGRGNAIFLFFCRELSTSVAVGRIFSMLRSIALFKYCIGEIWRQPNLGGSGTIKCTRLALPAKWVNVLPGSRVLTIYLIDLEAIDKFAFFKPRPCPFSETMPADLNRDFRCPSLMIPRGCSPFPFREDAAALDVNII